MKIMRVVCLVAAVVVAAGPAVPPAHAATQVSVWPATLSFGTPGGEFAWTSTVLGLRFDQGLAPMVGLRTTLQYGPVSGLTFGGASLSGYSGQTLAGEALLRVGLGAGRVGVGGFAGYGGYVLHASGPSASDRILLQDLGVRVGVDLALAVAPALSLRATYALSPSVNVQADYALSSPPASGQFTGTGSGSDLEAVLVFSPVPRTAVFAGYRSVTRQVSWTGGPDTTSSFTGWVVGLTLSF
ncbi:MAG: hypothetical protein QN173_08450 [Armatimonadota bacterium]|nr:hypothetical protein [Armatimonadota bacterium]MDR7400859.1 hypothetical protein [Armatimonadota bacterium]MDR7404684.1 hypothetical protein [Armatimonadota bacterium]MDR7437816.1 hypothetical protein [Armatimonadota bacterium]MDR7473141.1 hypothetical protein [Armatimonadota bacterium]